MKKKLIISLSVVGAIIVAIVILLFTLFGLRTYNSRFENVQQSVVQSGKFRYNTPVFFQNKQQYINNLEKANPYLKVIGIQTKFPGSMVVKCVDREDTFAIKISDQKYFIVDEDLKVLSAGNTYLNNQTNPIVLGGEFSVLNTDATIGDFLKLSAGQDVVENIIPVLKQNNRNISEAKAMFNNITLKFRIDPLTAKSEPYLVFEDFMGLKMYIYECNDDMVLKANCMRAAQSSIPVEEIADYELKIMKNSEGKIFCLQSQKT